MRACLSSSPTERPSFKHVLQVFADMQREMLYHRYVDSAGAVQEAPAWPPTVHSLAPAARPGLPPPRGAYSDLSTSATVHDATLAYPDISTVLQMGPTSGASAGSSALSTADAGKNSIVDVTMADWDQGVAPSLAVPASSSSLVSPRHIPMSPGLEEFAESASVLLQPLRGRPLHDDAQGGCPRTHTDSYQPRSTSEMPYQRQRSSAAVPGGTHQARKPMSHKEARRNTILSSMGCSVGLTSPTVRGSSTSPRSRRAIGSPTAQPRLFDSSLPSHPKKPVGAPADSPKHARRRVLQAWLDSPTGSVSPGARQSARSPSTRSPKSDPRGPSRLRRSSSSQGGRGRPQRVYRRTSSAGESVRSYSELDSKGSSVSSIDSFAPSTPQERHVFDASKVASLVHQQHTRRVAQEPSPPSSRTSSEADDTCHAADRVLGSLACNEFETTSSITEWNTEWTDAATRDDDMQCRIGGERVGCISESQPQCYDNYGQAQGLAGVRNGQFQNCGFVDTRLAGMPHRGPIEVGMLPAIEE